MSSEQNVPEGQANQAALIPPAQAGGPIGQNDAMADSSQHPVVPHGMGTSKSSRRRRRKRKNKQSDGGAQGAQANGQFAGDIQGGAQNFSPQNPQQNFQPTGQPQQQNAGGQGGKRWKKKFRDRQRNGDNVGNQASGGYTTGNGMYRDRDTHQPGNTVGGGKRKNKQRERGPRSFVGPMDHSYRGVSGNFADAPPATIDGVFGRANGSGRGGYVSDSQPIDYSIGRPIPIPDDAPTKIFFFIEDLFFNAKIKETARKLGVKVAFVKNDKEVFTELTSGEEADRPNLIVFDLNNANAKPLTLIPKLKSKLKKSTSIIGFLSHLQGDLKAKAVEAGCDTVMPRAAFSQNLPNLLRRYGTAEEEEEPNFNQ